MSEAAIGKEGWRPSKVHPLAALFPVLPPDDFDALAEDIRENGQQYPITIAEDGTLIDGRMRLDACAKAGVEPWFEFINGQDPVAFIWSVNTKRRQMTKGQMAMIAVWEQVSRVETPTGVETDLVLAAKQAGVTGNRISQASAIAKYAPHLVQEVIDAKPGMNLDKAYEVALINKRDKEARDKGIVTLRAEDRDLAQKVDDREMALEEARAIVDKRKAELAAAERELAAAEANRRETMFRLSEAAWQATTAWASADMVKDLEARLAGDDDFRETMITRLRLDPARVGDIQRGAKAFAAVVSRLVKEQGDV